MQSIWKRIEVWLEQNCPEILQGLLAGAKETEIHNCENYLGIQFPKELTQFYSCHNGQSDLSAPLMDDWHLLSLRNVAKQWKIMQELMEQDLLTGSVISDGKIQPVWWHPQWIPISSNGAGDFLCLDLAPTEIGDVGQIISFWHMSEERTVIAKSIKNWLDKFAQDIETGHYKVRRGMLIHRA